VREWLPAIKWMVFAVGILFLMAALPRPWNGLFLMGLAMGYGELILLARRQHSRLKKVRAGMTSRRSGRRLSQSRGD
jgi:hypothetical protein